MADVVNLNRARKAKAKAAAKVSAAENRARHGRTAAEKARDKAEADALRSRLDGAHREPPPE